MSRNNMETPLSGKTSSSDALSESLAWISMIQEEETYLRASVSL